MRPRTAKEIEVVRLRTRALIIVLIQRTKCANPYQFGAWINRESERLGWADTQGSNKWYHLIKGSLKSHPTDVISMLSQLFPDAERLYLDGPADLWRALWGDASDAGVLWPLCRTRFSNIGAWLEDFTWEEIEAEFTNEKTFGETLRNFEYEILSAKEYGEPLTLRHLTEAIALYRLHQAINGLALSDVNGSSAYRCIRHCLDDVDIWYQLKCFNGFYYVRDELVDLEIGRLTTEKSYLASVGIQMHQAMLYADDPLSWIDNGTHPSGPNLHRVTHSGSTVRVGHLESVRSRRRTTLSLVTASPVA